jgi:hypothetical protein
VTIKATLILAVVTAYTIASECSKSPEPKAAAESVHTVGHAVVSDTRPPAAPLALEDGKILARSVADQISVLPPMAAVNDAHAGPVPALVLK